ncbi:MAG: YigZ family protein [Propionibacterium sp.]|nr:YigZ family protein [Propionibacterium sp.]
MEIKRSRFLTRLRRVDDESAARAVIEERRTVHHDATHNCTAFILGPDGRTARSSDDGEPAGTAGIPMLTALQHNVLTDVVAVVTRYFGGIKLGGGGLVRAYSDAVAQAIEAAGIREVRLCRLLRVDVDYAEAGVVENQLRTLELPSGALLAVTDVEWGAASAHITVGVDERAVAEFEEALQTLSAGSLTARSVGEEWVDR